MTDLPEHPPKPTGLDEEGAKRTFDQMWEMYFGPEIANRQSDGRLSADFKVYIAQVLFPPNGNFRVLLNEEVEGVGLLRAPRAIEAGESVTLADLANIEAFDLPDELLDHGHFTIIYLGGSWRIVFNFQTGRAKSKDRLVNASHFLDAARASVEKGHAGPAVENLFAACELTAKAELILHRDNAANAKTHGSLASAINAWARLGNVDGAFVSLFNKLGQQRPNARYGDAESRPPSPTLEDIELVRMVIERGFQRVRKATDR